MLDLIRRSEELNPETPENTTSRRLPRTTQGVDSPIAIPGFLGAVRLGLPVDVTGSRLFNTFATLDPLSGKFAALEQARA
jgi:hypothetical protein